MLNALRSSGSNTFVWIIIGLLIVGLAGFGIGSSGGGAARTPVANVGDEPVTVDEYVRAINEQNRRFSAQYGTQLTMQDMRAAGIDQMVIEALLNDAAFSGEAARIGISVGDDIVLKELLASDAFRGLDGKFSKEQYEARLENIRLTPAEYEEIMRKARTRRIIQATVAGGIQVPETAARAIVSFQAEKRSLEWVRLLETHLQDPIGAPDETALKSHYDANSEDYRTPEIRDVTFAYLTEDMLMADIEIDPAEIAALYEDRADEFQSPARRIVDRIVYPDAATAEAALAKITAGDGDFDNAAADRGLGEGAIDLGEVTETDVNAAERAILFAATEPGVFGPIQSDLGPALYRINAVLDATTVSLADATEDLRGELAQEVAADLIAEATDAIEDLIASGATIEELANETDLTFGTLSINRDSTEGIAADIAFREEAFAASEAEERNLFDLSDGVAVLRVDKITDPKLPALDDVRAAVETAWRSEEVERRLIALAQSQKARIDEGAELGAIATDFGLVVTEEAPLGRSDIIEDTPPEFVREIFAAEIGKGAVVADADSVLLARITDIIAADPNAEEVALPTESVRGEIARNTAQDLLGYFAKGLQDSAGISVNQSLLENIQSQLTN